MLKKIVRTMALPCALVLTSVIAVAGGNIFRGLDSTVTGYSTWDADAINIENVSETGHGVHVAVLDTGLAPNYRDYFSANRIAAHLGKGFHQSVSFKAHKDECGLGITVGKTVKAGSFIGSVGSEHGTHVTSTILGFNYRANFDALQGFPIPALQVRGIAPEVTVIPVRVLSDYQLPALPKCGAGVPAQNLVFGTSEMVAAGIDYVTDLAIAGHRPMVINMSLGGGALEPVEKAALDRAIANGVIIVASAGNSGAAGMGFPGAYPPVISVAAAGWNNEFVDPTASFIYRMYWLQNGGDFVPPLVAGGGEVPEPTPATGGGYFSFDGGIYIVDFSSRELAGQELDITAPGVLIRGPFAGVPGYSHLPWWAKGIGDLVSGVNPGNFFYVSGTSMASPHVAGVAALMLEKNPTLTQAAVESILKSTALPITSPGVGGGVAVPPQVWFSDATGAGLVQADAAIAATP